MIRFIEDYKQRLKEATYSYFARNARIGSYIKAVGAVLQMAEEDVYGLIFSLPIRQASGRTLDKWGDIVGVQRRSLNDPAYRRVLLSRIGFSTGSGTYKNVLDAVSLYTGDPEPWMQPSRSGYTRVSFVGDLSVSEQERLLEVFENVASYSPEIIQTSTDPFTFGDTFGKAFGAERIDS